MQIFHRNDAMSLQVIVILLRFMFVSRLQCATVQLGFFLDLFLTGGSLCGSRALAISSFLQPFGAAQLNKTPTGDLR